MPKELLFSITAADCEFDYSVGTGKGGQKRNKTASKARCTHRPSGAVGVSDETRSQHQNKVLAFKKMAESAEFKRWHKTECARRCGDLNAIQEEVDRAMRDRNLKVEGKLNGKWTAIEECTQDD